MKFVIWLCAAFCVVVFASSLFAFYSPEWLRFLIGAAVLIGSVAVMIALERRRQRREERPWE